MNLGEVDNSAGDNESERSGYRKRSRTTHDESFEAGGALPVNGNGSSNSGRGGDSRGQDSSRGSGDRFERQGSYGGDRYDRPRAQAMEVIVENNVEKAMKVLKRKLIKEGLFKELKSRRYYEKPSEKKKRKHKESVKKIRKEEARQKRNPFLFS